MFSKIITDILGTFMEKHIFGFIKHEAEGMKRFHQGEERRFPEGGQTQALRIQSAPFSFPPGSPPQLSRSHAQHRCIGVVLTDDYFP